MFSNPRLSLSNTLPYLSEITYIIPQGGASSLTILFDYTYGNVQWYLFTVHNWCLCKNIKVCLCRHLGIIYIFTFVTFYFLNNLAHKKNRNELIILSYLEVLFDTTNMRSVTFWPRKFGFFCYSVQVHVPTLYLDMPNKVNYIPFLKCF